MFKGNKIILKLLNEIQSLRVHHLLNLIINMYIQNGWFLRPDKMKISKYNKRQTDIEKQVTLDKKKTLKFYINHFLLIFTRTRLTSPHEPWHPCEITKRCEPFGVTYDRGVDRPMNGSRGGSTLTRLPN